MPVIDSAFARYLLQRPLVRPCLFVAVALNFFLPGSSGKSGRGDREPNGAAGRAKRGAGAIVRDLHGRVWPRPAGPRPVHPVLERGFPRETSAPRLCFTPARCLMSSGAAAMDFGPPDPRHFGRLDLRQRLGSGGRVQAGGGSLTGPSLSGPSPCPGSPTTASLSSWSTSWRSRGPSFP